MDFFIRTRILDIIKIVGLVLMEDILLIPIRHIHEPTQKWTNNMQKMLMLATTAAMIEQFNKNNILILEKKGYEVHVAGNWDEGNPISDVKLNAFKIWITEHNGQWFDLPSTRNPGDIFNNSKTYKRVLELVRKNNYKFIHVHTPIVSVIGRLVAHKTKTPIIYTAHGFHFFHGAPIKNWVIFYPVEKYMSKYTDILVTINNEDYWRALNKFKARSVYQIPGVGLDIEEYKNHQIDIIEKRKTLGISPDKFVLLSVGELKDRKNHKIVLDALHLIDHQNIIYLIAGQGELKKEYEKKVKKYKLEGCVKFLGFRDDILDLCKISDCFVHTSIREGLGIAPLEGMATGLPLISSYVNGIKDYTEDGVTGCCINPYDANEVASAIKRMEEDIFFRTKCGKNNLEIVKKYDIHNANKIMTVVYDQIANEKDERR